MPDRIRFEIVALMAVLIVGFADAKTTPPAENSSRYSADSGQPDRAEHSADSNARNSQPTRTEHSDDNSRRSAQPDPSENSARNSCNCFVPDRAENSSRYSDDSAQPDRTENSGDSNARNSQPGATQMATNPSGVTGRGIPGGPGGAPVAVLEEMTRIYADATEANVRAIGKAIERLSADPDSSGGQFQLDRARAVERQIMDRLVRLDQQLRSPLSAGVLSAIDRGAAETEREARKFGLGGDSSRAGGQRDGSPRFGGAVTTGINDRAVELLATDAVAAMTDRLNRAARDQMGEGLRLFRAVAAGSELAGNEPGINRAIGRALVTGNPRDGVRAMRELFRDPESDAALTYRKLGNRQITVGGWTGPTRAYASTLFRTRSREVSVAAKHERARELGVETFQITGRVSENFCTRFIGVVYTLGSTTGLPDFVISASELPGGPPPFHPNCSKSSVLYILGLAGSTREGNARKAKAAFETARQRGELTMKVA